MNNFLKAVLLIIVLFAVIGIADSNNNSGNSFSTNATHNTQMNAAYDSCDTTFNQDSNNQYPDSAVQSYCHCTVDGMYAEYGDRVFTTSFLNSLNSNGFNQNDTQMIMNCLSGSGIQ